MNKNIYKDAVNDIKADSRLIIETEKKMKGMKEMQEIKRKRYSMYRYGALAVCLIVLIISTFFMNNITKPLPAENPTAVKGSEYLPHLDAGKIITLADNKGELFINEIGGMSSGKLRVPEGATNKELSIEELSEYFGRNPLPAILDGFKTDSDKVNVIFNPDGSIFYMSEIRYYKDINDTASPSISIQLNKEALPLRDCIFKSEDEKQSTIGNTKLVIGSQKMSENFSEKGEPSGYYDVFYSEFIYNGIGYNISAERIAGTTFIQLLQSIIK